MKKAVSALVIFMVAISMSYAAPKKDAKTDCNRNCAASFKQCKKDAKGDKNKIAACKTTHKDCKAACPK